MYNSDKPKMLEKSFPRAGILKRILSNLDSNILSDRAFNLLVKILFYSNFKFNDDEKVNFFFFFSRFIFKLKSKIKNYLN